MKYVVEYKGLYADNLTYSEADDLVRFALKSFRNIDLGFKESEVRSGGLHINLGDGEMITVFHDKQE